ncbi:MAG: AAA family ATPase, partial [Thermoleophilia bacterium]|nr:AAA family ATPase [Thermoleophilia bacterium]
GVTSDLAFTGWRGSEHRAEYALIGSGVNLAARLMMQADPILCDANTRLAVGRRVLFESIAPIWVKGRSDAIRVYRPRSVQADASASSLLGSQSSLIGRDLERQTLERRLAELDSAARGGVVFVEGEPGVGKSSLVRHLIAAAQRTSVRTVVGAGDATEQKTSMLAWKPVMSTLLGAFVTLDEAAVSGRLRDLLGDERADAFPVLDPILPLRLPSTSLSRHISPQGRAEMIRGLLRRLLAATATRGPVLLVLDDGHWMDSASWEFAEVAREVPGLLLVVAMRPMTARPPPCQRLLDDVGTTVIRLDVIGAAETVALACQLLDVDTLPEEVASFVQRRAEGHPLFIEQLTHALMESGHLEIIAHECRLVGSPKELDRLEVPETVSGLVRARIDALEPEQQLTLKVASVLGRHFELDGLRVVHPLTNDHEVLSQHVQAMVTFGLLRPPQNGNEDWEFRHALIRESAYELLPFSQRRELHLATARWLERRFEHEPRAVHAALGHHFEHAGDHEAAIRHFTAAGDQAVELWENTEVVHFFDRVIRLDAALGDTGTVDEVVRASWERKVGEALCNLGELDRGVPLLRRALKRLGLHVPKRQAVLVIGLALRLLRLLTRGPRPPTRSVKSEGEARIVMETVSVVMPLSAAAYPLGGGTESIYLHLRGLDLARRLGPTAKLADVYVGVSNIAAMAHRLRIARAYAAQGAEMAERQGDLAVLGASLCAGQLFEVTVANFGALESIERGTKILAQIGDNSRWQTGVLMLSNFRLMQGEFELSLESATEVLTNAREVGAALQELWALAAVANCQLHLGRLDEAISSAHETLELARTTASSDRIAPFKAAGVLASAWLRRHGGPPPAEILELGEDAMENGGWQSYSPGSDFVGLAEARLAAIEAGQGDRAEHLRRLRVLAGRLKRTVFLRPVARSTLLWLRAEIDWQTGRKRRSERLLRGAIESADGYRLPFEGGRLRVALARKLALDNPERSHLLSAAADAFSAADASWELAETRRLET